MNVLHIARFTVHEAVRRKLILAGVLISLVFIALYAFGFSFMFNRTSEFQSRSGLAAGTAAMTLFGLYAVSFLSSFLALFLSVSSISGEIDGGTLHAILARPIRRSEYIAGRWLGFAGIIALYVATMAASLLTIARLISGYEAHDPLRAVCLMALSALVLLTLSLLGSSLFSTLANGVLVFSLFGLAWMAGIIEFIGGAIGNQSMVTLGVIVSLILPSDALWHGASYYVQSPLALSLLSEGRDILPFASSSPPTLALILWSLGHVMVMLFTAMTLFSYRDL